MHSKELTNLLGIQEEKIVFHAKDKTISIPKKTKQRKRYIPKSKIVNSKDIENMLKRY